jgi:uncharacterized protein YjlB
MNLMAQVVQPEKAYFQDDGSIPNSELPLMVYRQAFVLGASDLAATIEEYFARNDWTGSWRASVFPFHHYHSETHEVLAVYRGTATLQFGGEKGRELTVKPGDVVVIPAGVGHKRERNFGGQPSTYDFNPTSVESSSVAVGRAERGTGQIRDTELRNGKPLTLCEPIPEWARPTL